VPFFCCWRPSKWHINAWLRIRRMGQTNCCASSRQSGRVWGRSLHYAECLRALLIYQVMARLWSCQPNSSHSTFLHSISSYSIATHQSNPVETIERLLYLWKWLAECEVLAYHPSRPRPRQLPTSRWVMLFRLLPHHCTLVRAICFPLPNNNMLNKIAPIEWVYFKKPLYSPTEQEVECISWESRSMYSRPMKNISGKFNNSPTRKSIRTCRQLFHATNLKRKRKYASCIMKAS